MLFQGLDYDTCPPNPPPPKPNLATLGPREGCRAELGTQHTGSGHAHLTFKPPASTRWRVLQTNMPPFSTSFLQCRKAKLWYR